MALLLHKIFTCLTLSTSNLIKINELSRCLKLIMTINLWRFEDFICTRSIIGTFKEWQEFSLKKMQQHQITKQFCIHYWIITLDIYFFTLKFQVLGKNKWRLELLEGRVLIKKRLWWMRQKKVGISTQKVINNLKIISELSFLQNNFRVRFETML